MNRSSVFGVEGVVELRQGLEFALQESLGQDQSSDPEVVGPGLLSETAAGHESNAGVLEDLEAVEKVGRLSLTLGGLDGLLGEGDAGEGVHGPLDLVALDVHHLVEVLGHNLGPVLQRLEDEVGFGQVLLLGLGRDALEGRVDHQVHYHLPRGSGAQAYGFELNHLLDDIGVEVVEVEVASPHTALSKESLGAGVKGRQFTFVFDLSRHRFQNFSEGTEDHSLFVDVLPVDLSQQQSTSSAMTIRWFLTEKAKIFFIVSELKIAPVGFPGLMTTIALTFLP